MLIRFLLLLLIIGCDHENSCPLTGKDRLAATSAECQFLVGRSAYSVKDYAGAAARWTQASQTASKDSRETNFVASATGTLGYLYLNGMGVDQDKTKAINCFQTAIRLGDIESRNHLAFAYSNPRDERYDPIRAYAWYKTVTRFSIQDFDDTISPEFAANILADAANGMNLMKRSLSAADIADAEKLAETLN